MKLTFWRIMPLLVFLLLAIFLWRGLALEPQKLPSVQIGQALPDFKLAELNSPQVSFTAKQLRGKISLLNVWASWCAACIDEQVFLMQLSKEGIPLFGLNYKDNSENAKQWLAEWGNPYQLIGEDSQGKVAIDLGVYGAPETFLIDQQGIIRFRHVGVLNEESWKRDFLPRIKQLQG